MYIINYYMDRANLPSLSALAKAGSNTYDNSAAMQEPKKAIIRKRIILNRGVHSVQCKR